MEDSSNCNTLVGIEPIGDVNNFNVNSKTLELTIGMVFDWKEDFKSFYRKHACKKGFGLKIRNSKKRRWWVIKLFDSCMHTKYYDNIFALSLSCQFCAPRMYQTNRVRLFREKIRSGLLHLLPISIV